jgi:DUF4097 and DUF4098 domain-containing protein YvlB
MPIYQTPEPILAIVDTDVGNVRIVAGDRTETIVEVVARNAAEAADAKAADEVSVAFADRELLVKGRKHWTRHLPFRRSGSVEITIELPAGSRLTAELTLGDVRCEGSLADCRIVTGMGDITLDRADDAHLRSGYGDIVADRIEGDADVSTGSGEVRIGAVAGAARIRSGNGGVQLGEVGGDGQVKSANGRITIARAGGAMHAKTAAGRIRIGEIVQGEVVLETGLGEVEVGVREGTSAWLDLHTGYGGVRNSLAPATGPEPTVVDELEPLLTGNRGATAHVRVHTAAGDIVIRRSSADDATEEMEPGA